ncbi:MAG: hypothetical protein E4H14_08350 [Candidatus Thorarchaeota archaeon]|nr:MAG: hypothetical protein E4H14_08350 [Candidatus Thorarchaeota archaeon]
MINATSIFDFIESVSENIKAVDDLHFVTVSDVWPPDFEEDWWTTGLVPSESEGRLRNLTDIIALCYYSDYTIPNPVGARMKYGEIVESASTQPYNHSRELNSKILLNAYVEAINKSYSAFCPWEFSQNVIVHEGSSAISNYNRHDWTWDALLLFSLYRNDSVKFINTTNWYVLSSEPQFDAFGRIGFTLFHRPESAYPTPFGFEDGRSYDPADGGTTVSILSINLLIGDAFIINKQSNSDEPLYNQEELGICEYTTNLATVYDVGHVEETGIRVESNHTWEATVERYDNFQIVINMNTTGPVNIEIESGNFTLTKGTDYAVSYTDMSTGATWVEIVKADENKTIRLSLNTESITIRIVPDQNTLGILSVGMSASVIVISVVIYIYMDRRTRKGK